MSKSMLIIDTPKSCGECDFVCDDCSGLYCIPSDRYFDGEDGMEERPSWCPLRELPEKMQVCGKYPQPDGIVPSYKIGWNACLDTITGEVMT